MCYFFFNDTATTEIYTYRHTLSLHDALPISPAHAAGCERQRPGLAARGDRIQPPPRCLWRPQRHRRHRSEEHTSELQSLMRISYAVFCLKKKKKKNQKHVVNIDIHTLTV